MRIRQTMLGEFLSANVSTPFVLFMVKGVLDEIRRCSGLIQLQGSANFQTQMLPSGREYSVTSYFKSSLHKLKLKNSIDLFPNSIHNGDPMGT